MARVTNYRKHMKASGHARNNGHTRQIAVVFSNADFDRLAGIAFESGIAMSALIRELCLKGLPHRKECVIPFDNQRNERYTQCINTA